MNEKNNLLSKINNSYYKPEIYASLGLLILVIALSFASPYFFTARNLINVARQVSLYAIVASGMTFVILTGGIDLSVGSVVAITGTITAGMIKSGLPVTVSLLIGIIIGIAFGLFNGLIIANTRIPAIIVTLATMTIARGSALLYSNGYPISGMPASYTNLGRGYIGPFPIPVYVMVIIFVIMYIILNKSKFGRYVYALGGNEETVRLSGISVKKLKMKVYMLTGLMAGISGLLLSSRLGSGQPLAGDGWELDVIAAVVVGGTDIAGGRGTMIGTLIGAFIIGILNNGLNLLNVSPYLQLVVRGFVIIFAVFVRAGRVKKK
jgi:ribose transport system permease protein